MMTLEIAKFETPTLEPFCLLFFAVACEKIFISKRVTLKVDVLQDQEIIVLFAGASVHLSALRKFYRLGQRRG